MQQKEKIESSSLWSYNAGDPTIEGWMIAAAYVVCAFVCLRAYIIAPEPTNGKSRPNSNKQFNSPLFWFLIGVCLLLLGINKQLDIQTLFTDLLRDNAIEYGWYENRRIWQKIFILVLGSGTFLTCLFIAVNLDGSIPGIRPAFFGFISLAGYVVARAASFHHFDLALSLEFKGITLLSFVEPAGILVILVSALRFFRYVRSCPDAIREPLQKSGRDRVR